MVACSLFDDATAGRLTGSATGVLTGAGREGGSGLRLGDVLPVWLGFHIALKTIFPFLSLLGRGFPRRGHLPRPEPICSQPVGGAFRAPPGNHSKIASPSWSAKMLRPDYSKPKDWD